MDFLLSQNNLWILLIALISGAMLLWPSLRKGRPNGRVTLDVAIQQVNREHGVFIDIRNDEQYRAGTIPQARHVPLESLNDSHDKLPKDKPIVLLADKPADGTRAVALLKQHGHTQVACLEGGLNTWIQGGMPVKKS